MTQRGYDVLNEGNPIACPNCGETAPERVHLTHGGEYRCGFCGERADLQRWKDAAATAVKSS